jgi:hypothetical protein
MHAAHRSSGLREQKKLTPFSVPGMTSSSAVLGKTISSSVARGIHNLDAETCRLTAGYLVATALAALRCSESEILPFRVRRSTKETD